MHLYRLDNVIILSSLNAQSQIPLIQSLPTTSSIYFNKLFWQQYNLGYLLKSTDSANMNEIREWEVSPCELHLPSVYLVGQARLTSMSHGQGKWKELKII